MDTMEKERRRLEEEKQQLLDEKDHETEQWRQRYQEMTKRNDENVANLADANQCYMRQVSENEKLTKNIEDLQKQHRVILLKYKEMEQRL